MASKNGVVEGDKQYGIKPNGGAAVSTSNSVNSSSKCNLDTGIHSGKRKGDMGSQQQRQEATTKDHTTLNFQEIVLSVLKKNGDSNSSGGNTSHGGSSVHVPLSLQSELSTALTKQIQKNSAPPAAVTRKRPRTDTPQNKALSDKNDNDVVVLSDDEDQDNNAGNNKRMRFERGDSKPAATHKNHENEDAHSHASDDKFIDDFYEDELGMAVNTDLDKLMETKKADDNDQRDNQPNLDQQQQQQQQEALEQQKTIMLQWFSDNLNDLEQTIQTILKQKANDLLVKTLQLEQQTQRTIQLQQDNKQLTDMIQKLQQHQLNRVGGKLDIARIEKAQQEYKPARDRIREFLMQNIRKESWDEYTQCTQLLSDEIKYNDNLSQAIQDQLLEIEAQHWNERSSDRNTIADLRAQLEAAEEQAARLDEAKTKAESELALQRNPQTSNTNYEHAAAVIRDLQKNLALSRQSTTVAQESEQQVQTANEALKAAYTATRNEVVELNRKLEYANRNKVQFENQVGVLRRQIQGLQRQVQLLRTNNQQQALVIQQANNNSNASQQQQTRRDSHPQQQKQNAGSALNSQSQHHSDSEVIQRYYDRSLKENQERHNREMRSTIANHMGAMKGNALRMESLAKTIKELSARNLQLEAHINELTRTNHKNGLGRGRDDDYVPDDNDDEEDLPWRP